MRFRLNGLIAATYTPLHADGTLNLDAVPPMVERLIQEQITGLYVCGSTGEGMSLTGDERRQVAEAFVHSAAGRLPVVVRVGHNSLAEARQTLSFPPGDEMHPGPVGPRVRPLPVAPTAPQRVAGRGVAPAPRGNRLFPPRHRMNPQAAAALGIRQDLAG
jgi:hypothetical protein